MKKWVVSGIVVLAIIVAAVGGYLLKSANTPATTLKANQTAVNKPEVASKPPTRAELLKLVNEQRAKVGVAPLTEDPRLDWSAQQKADDMVKYDYYAHESPLSPNDNGDSRQWLLASGIKCADTSENLDENSNASTAVSAWVKSKPHYTAMVNSKYTLTGFGVAGKDKDGYYLLVEHFCQP